MTKISNEKMVSYSIIFLGAVALTMSLVFTKTVLLPFVFSIFVYSVLSPVIHRIQGKVKMPRIVAIVISGVITFVILAIIILLMVHSMQNFLDEADSYRSKLASWVANLQDLAISMNIELDANSLQEELNNLPIFNLFKSITGGLLSIVGNVFLVGIFSIFLLAGEQSIANKPQLMDEIQEKISRYVSMKFLVSLGTGLLVGAVLFVFNVELAFMFAMLAFLLNFIPSIGSVIATILPLPVVFLQFDFGLKFFAVVLFLVAIQVVVGNILEPKVMGESMDLHPVTILLFLMFWGLVWGIPGMFLAVPITAILKIVLSRIEATKPLSGYLAGRFS